MVNAALHKRSCSGVPAYRIGVVETSSLWRRCDVCKRNTNNEVQPLDPVALTLAIWLGVMLGVGSVVRMSANLPNPAFNPSQAGAVPPVMAMAFGN